MIDLDVARAWLREHDVPVEIDDPDILDAAVAVFSASPQSEGPGSSRPGLATSEKDFTWRLPHRTDSR
jgi:hypothetical protein